MSAEDVIYCCIRSHLFDCFFGSFLIYVHCLKGICFRINGLTGFLFLLCGIFSDVIIIDRQFQRGMDQVIDAFQRIDRKAFFQKLRVKGQDVALSDIRMLASILQEAGYKTGLPSCSRKTTHPKEHYQIL